MIDEQFGQSLFSLRSLFRDEQKRVLDILLKSTNADLEELNLQAFERTAPLMRFLMDLGLALPSLFKHLADAAINSQLKHALAVPELHAEVIKTLLESAQFWHIDLDKEGLAFVLGGTIESLARESHEKPGDLSSLRRLKAAVALAKQMPFRVNFYKTQNSYYDTLKHRHPELKASAEKSGGDARSWVEEFKELGSMLSVKVD
jgi:hypothetical protein